MYHSRIGRHFACKMAMLLALMFAACSNDDTKQPTVAHDGGYTEETGIYAFSGHIGNKRPKLMKLSGDVPQSKENTLSVDKGTIFTIYELDSTTLNKTGRFFVDTIALPLNVNNAACGAHRIIQQLFHFHAIMIRYLPLGMEVLSCPPLAKLKTPPNIGYP